MALRKVAFWNCFRKSQGDVISGLQVRRGILMKIVGVVSFIFIYRLSTNSHNLVSTLLVLELEACTTTPPFHNV